MDLDLNGWGMPSGDLAGNVERARLAKAAADVRYVNVPAEPMICGSCFEVAVTREADEREARYVCGSCGAERIVRRKWECAEARAEALLINKPTPKGR